MKTKGRQLVVFQWESTEHHYLIRTLANLQASQGR